MNRLFLPLFFLLVVAPSLAGCPFLPVVKDGKWGFIDCHGNLRISCQYDLVSEFRDGYSVVKNDGLTGVIDTTGRTVFPLKYQGIRALNSGYFILEENSLALSNKKGEFLTDFKYSNIIQVNSRSFLLQEEENGYKLYHADLKIFSPGIWSRVREIDSSGFLQLWNNYMTAVVDSLHNVIIHPVQGGEFLKVGSYFVYEKNNLYSFYNMGGELVSGGIAWKNFEFVHDDYVMVYNIPNDISLLSLINKNYILEHKYSKFRVLNNRMVVMKKLKAYGIADTSGKVFHDCYFDAIAAFSDKYYIVKKGRNFGLLDKKAKEILPLDCEFIDPENPFGLIVFSRNGRLGLLRNDGKIFKSAIYDDIEIDNQKLKCYSGSSLDIYLFDENRNLDETMHFANVHRINLGRRYRSWNGDYFLNGDNDIWQRNPRGPIRTMEYLKGERYGLLLKAHSYAPTTRMKTLIKNNIKDVEFLVGLRSIAENRFIVAPDYWDICLEDMEKYDLARIILPTGRHGIIRSTGQVTSIYSMRESGRMINRTMTYIGPFCDGLARVNLGGAYTKGEDIKDPRRTISGYSLKIRGGIWGYFNTNGEMALLPKFEYASDFINGKAIVCIDHKYGVIDTQGRFVIEPNYGFISWLPESDHKFFQLQEIKNQEGLIDSDGHVLLRTLYDEVGEVRENMISVKKDGLWGFCNLNGTLTIEPAYMKVSGFYEGLSAVKLKGRWGYIDKSGKLVIEPTYTSAGSFSEGLSPVRDRTGCRYINASGQEVIRGKFSRGESFKDGIAVVKHKKRWGAIDFKGKLVIKPKYKSIRRSKYNLIACKRLSRYFLYSKSGKKLNGKAYNWLGKPSENLISFNQGKKSGFLDTTGNVAFYRSSKFYTGSFHEGLAYVRLLGSGYSGFINTEDSIQIKDKFRWCYPFSEGMAVCYLEGHTTVIDHFGGVVFSLEDEKRGGEFRNGYLVIGGKFYNKSGEMVLKAEKASPFSNDRAIISMTEKIAGTDKVSIRNELLDPNLTPIASYSSIVPQESGYYTISTESSNGLADLNGNILLNCKFQNIKYIGNEIFQIENYGNLGYIKKDGKWIWNPEL